MAMGAESVSLAGAYDFFPTCQPPGDIEVGCGRVAGRQNPHFSIGLA